VLDMAEVLSDKEAMMCRQPPTQRVFEPLARAPQPSMRLAGKRRRIRLSCRDAVQDRPPREAEDVGDDRRELDVGVLEHLLDAVGVAGALLNEPAAIARQIAELTLLETRDEGTAQQPVAQEVCDPLGVFDVGLSAGHGLEVLGVDDEQLELALEKIE